MSNYLLAFEAPLKEIEDKIDSLKATGIKTGIDVSDGIKQLEYDLYQEGLDTTNDSWSSHTFTTIQGGFVDQKEIEEAQRDLDKKTFEQEFEATFVTYSGLVYYGFKRSENVKEFRFTTPQKMIHIGIDFNIDPISATCFVIDNNKIIVIDEIEMYGSNTDELVNEIYSRFPGTKIFAYPDPSARARKTTKRARAKVISKEEEESLNSLDCPE